MRFSAQAVRDLIDQHAPITMADCFTTPTDGQVARAHSFAEVTQDDFTRLSYLVNPKNPHFVYLDGDGNFRSAFFSHLFTNKDTRDPYVGSVSIATPGFDLSPLLFARVQVTGAILGITVKAWAIKYGLKYSETNVNEAITFQQAMPTHVAWFAAAGYPNVNLADDSTSLVVAAFPRVLLTEPAYVFPDGVAANLTSINTMCTDAQGNRLVSEFEYMWYLMMVTSWTHFDGRGMSRSFDHTGGLFNYDYLKIDMDPFNDVSTIYRYVSYAEHDILKPDTSHVLYDAVMESTTEAFGELMTDMDFAVDPPNNDTPRGGRSTTPRESVGGTPGGTPGGANRGGSHTPRTPQRVHMLSEILQRLVDHQTTPTNNTPGQDKDTALISATDSAVHARRTWYEHFLARIGADGVAAVPALAPHFEEFLRTKIDGRARIIHGLLRIFMARDTTKGACGHAQSPGLLFDKPFINAIFQPYWLAEMSDLAVHSQYSLLFGSFGPPPISLDATANKRKIDELVAQRQRDNDADGSHIIAEPTTLYVNKIVNNDSDLLAIFGNFETTMGSFCLDMYEDASHLPSIVSMLTLIFKILVKDNGRRWMRKQFELYSNFGEFLTTKMNSLVMQYVAIAQTASMMHLSDPVPDASNYQMAEIQFKTFAGDLQSAIAVNTLPNTFRPVLRSAAPLVGFPAAPAGGYNPVYPPQHQRQAALQNPVYPPQQHRQAPPPTGIICHPGSVAVTDRVTLPTGVFGLSPSGEQLPLCLNHILVGRTCNAGTCNRFHMFKLGDLPGQCVPIFRTWMGTNNLVFLDARTAISQEQTDAVNLAIDQPELFY